MEKHLGHALAQKSFFFLIFRMHSVSLLYTSFGYLQILTR